MYAIVLRDLTFITQTNSAFAALITLQPYHTIYSRTHESHDLTRDVFKNSLAKNRKSALPTPKKGGQYTPK